MKWYIWLWVGCWVPTLLGTFVIIMWIKPEKDDGVTDASNRFNRVRATWWSLTRRKELIMSLPWLANDEGENLK